MERAKVSIIIPSFNSAHFVVDAVESVLKQTVHSTEIIVIDDGSTDDTQARLAPRRDRITVIHQNNAGLSGARNTGLRAASGEWVAFLDADDAWHPRKLELQLKALQSQPGPGLIATATLGYPSELPSRPSRRMELLIEELPLEKLLGFGITSRHLQCWIRRSIAAQVGESDTSLPNAE